MPTSLPYGFVKPQTGDSGSVWCPVIEDDLTQISIHNHDGVNSAPISGSVITSASVLAAAADWVLVSPGVYKQTKSVPAGYNIDTSMIYTKINSTSQITYNEVIKLSAVQFEVYSNTNSESIRVYFK